MYKTQHLPPTFKAKQHWPLPSLKITSSTFFLRLPKLNPKRACAIWSNLIHTLWACADAIWVRNSIHLMSWDTKEVWGRLIMVSTDPNSFTAFFLFLYRQLLPPFYDIRIFTYFRSMSCYRIINFAKLPLTKCHKIIMRKYNRNKVRLLREILIKMIAWIMSYKHHFVFCFQIIEFDNIKYRLPSCTWIRLI